MSTVTKRCVVNLLKPAFRQQGVAYVRQLSASLRAQDQMLLVKEQPGQEEPMIFPGIWLRDNCQCEQCFHQDSLSRKPLRWNNFDTKVKVRHITVSEI